MTRVDWLETLDGLNPGAEPVFPPGVRVGLEPPGDLRLSQQFPGFQDSERKASITILDLPGRAYDDIERAVFTEELLVALMSRGVPVAPLTLHTGVSSPEPHEPPYPERFAVPEVTARLVNSTRRAGRRVVAVGTTVTRALESATDEDGVTHPATGWTHLVLGPDRPARAVTGLITGLHDPQASHLRLLEAVAGPDLVAAAYARAVAEHYLWHEFGDSMLFLP